MIEWMQTHRKWLVITIWVATIAFIGAGFVGWGQFKFGTKESTVAEVKDTVVTLNDWQNAYTQLYNQVNAQMGGNLDEATAKKLGLKKMALQKAIQDAIFRQFAKDMGLYVTDKELAKKILEVFGSKKRYQLFLRERGLKAAEFEKNLRKEMLVEKLFSFFNLKPSKTELLSVASALYNADNMDIKVLKKSKIKIDLSEDEIKKFWEKNKNLFLSPEKYKIALIKIPLKTNANLEELKKYYEENKLKYKNEKGEILSFQKALNLVKKDYAAETLKRKAVMAYKDLKDNKGDYNIVTIPLNNKMIPLNKMQTLISKGYLKPFINNNSYIVAKLLEDIKPRPLPYEKAKLMVIQTLMNKKAIQKLIEISKKNYKDFKGENTGFITKFDFYKIKKLPLQYSEEFLNSVFISQKPNYFILIPKNNPKYSVLYKIKEQKLLDKKEYEKNKKIVYNLTKNLLDNEFLNDLLNHLETTYKIKVYVK